VYRPYLKVHLRASGEEIPVFALVDSGSQVTMLHISLARELKINLAQCKKVKVGGVGGDGRIGYESEVELVFPDFPGTHLLSPVVFAECQAEALLGQLNFFSNFKVLFEGHVSVFKLNPIVRMRR